MSKSRLVNPLLNKKSVAITTLLHTLWKNPSVTAAILRRFENPTVTL